MVQSDCEMTAIGGYFELADLVDVDNFPHTEGILLNTGRNALEYILRSIEKIKRIYIPYFTCEVVLEPIKRLGIPYRYYHVTADLEILDDIDLQEGEYIIVNNYFGIMDRYIQSVYGKFKEHLIVDCAQAFFAPTLPGIKAFYSPRKFVGVADGGVAYVGNGKGEDISNFESEPTERHCEHLVIRKDQGAEAGFKCYQADEESLDDQPIRRMSHMTYDILRHIDYERVKVKRLVNWQVLNDALSVTNKLHLPMVCDFECPMVYPYMVDDGAELRKRLIDRKVFVAMYWPNVLPYKGFEFEASLANNIVSLPLDQRYGEAEMRRIIDMITQ